MINLTYTKEGTRRYSMTPATIQQEVQGTIIKFSCTTSPKTELKFDQDSRSNHQFTGNNGQRNKLNITELQSLNPRTLISSTNKLKEGKRGGVEKTVKKILQRNKNQVQ